MVILIFTKIASRGTVTTVCTAFFMPRMRLLGGAFVRLSTSSKSPGTPWFRNLLAINEIVKCPMQGGDQLSPPCTSVKSNTLILNVLAILAVEGELHEASGSTRTESRNLLIISILPRFLRALRLVEMTKGMRLENEMTRGVALGKTKGQREMRAGRSRF